MPPKKIPIDEDRIRQLASLGLTIENIAHIEKISVRTIMRRCGNLVKEGKSSGKSALLVKMYNAAMQGNITASIFLLKTIHGLSERNEAEVLIAHADKIVYKAKWGSSGEPPEGQEGDNA